jgi:hypothetical protein
MDNTSRYLPTQPAALIVGGDNHRNPPQAVSWELLLEVRGDVAVGGPPSSGHPFYITRWVFTGMLAGRSRGRCRPYRAAYLTTGRRGRCWARDSRRTNEPQESYMSIFRKQRAALRVRHRLGIVAAAVLIMGLGGPADSLGPVPQWPRRPPVRPPAQLPTPAPESPVSAPPARRR